MQLWLIRLKDLPDGETCFGLFNAAVVRAENPKSAMLTLGQHKYAGPANFGDADYIVTPVDPDGPAEIIVLDYPE